MKLYYVQVLKIHRKCLEYEILHNTSFPVEEKAYVTPSFTQFSTR